MLGTRKTGTASYRNALYSFETGLHPGKRSSYRISIAILVLIKLLCPLTVYRFTTFHRKKRDNCNKSMLRSKVPHVLYNLAHVLYRLPLILLILLLLLLSKRCFFASIDVFLLRRRTFPLLTIELLLPAHKLRMRCRSNSSSSRPIALAVRMYTLPKL
jgi:hypothetical protein